MQNWTSKNSVLGRIKKEVEKKTETYIFSALTYGSETRALTEEAKRRMNVFKIRCYRRILRISWIYVK